MSPNVIAAFTHTKVIAVGQFISRYTQSLGVLVMQAMVDYGVVEVDVNTRITDLVDEYLADADDIDLDEFIDSIPEDLRIEIWDIYKEYFPEDITRMVDESTEWMYWMFDPSSSKQITAWAAMGFQPWELVPVDNWVDDAAGYILDPGMYGFEIVDDIVGIAFPELGIMDLVGDILSQVKEGMIKYNDIADQYNQLRLSIIAAFGSGDEALAEWISSLIDQTVLPEDLTEDVRDMADEIIQEVEKLPVMPEIADWVLEMFPDLEFSPLDWKNFGDMTDDMIPLIVGGPVGKFVWDNPEHLVYTLGIPGAIAATAMFVWNFFTKGVEKKPDSGYSSEEPGSSESDVDYGEERIPPKIGEFE
jgi:hypothetical protein